MRNIRKYLDLFFKISNFTIIILYLYPGSILGYLLYGQIYRQPQLTKDFMSISSNHVYAYLLLSILALVTYYKSNKIIILNYLILSSIILFIMCIPGLFLKKPENEKVDVNLVKEPVKSDSVIKVLKESFAHKGFRLLVLGFFVCGFQITLVATHVPRYVQDRGLDDWTGFAILSLIGLFNIIGVLISILIFWIFNYLKKNEYF